MVELKLLNKEGLDDFVNSPEFERLPSIPITRHRALSHIRNPRIDANDVLLILAYADNEMAGYLGILPDRIFTSPEKSYRCGAFSCIWVNPEIRGKGIALTLVEKAHELYDKIVVADPVPSTISMYNRSSLFAEPVKIDGVRLYMRMDMHSILPPKRKFFRTIKPLLHLGDAVTNFFFDSRFLFFKKRIEGVNLEQTTNVDDETATFISERQNDQLYRRGQNELNWIINFPWVLVRQKPDRDAHRYFFTSSDKSFDQYCLKLRNDQNELVAFLIFTKRNRVLKLPYVYMKPGVAAMVAKVIMQCIYKWRINTFTTFQPELSEYFLSHRTGVIHKKSIGRYFLFSNELAQVLKTNSFELQDGDADLAFT